MPLQETQGNLDAYELVVHFLWLHVVCTCHCGRCKEKKMVVSFSYRAGHLNGACFASVGQKDEESCGGGVLK